MKTATEILQNVEVIGTLDSDLLMQYVNLAIILLLFIAFLLALILGALLGHFIIYRIRG